MSRRYNAITFVGLIVRLMVALNLVKANNNKDDDNFIITHYGTERYTPVKREDMRIYNDGYFKSEVIAVDPISGDELKSSKDDEADQSQQRQHHYSRNPDGDNIFVPVHTGYSINVAQQQQPEQQQQQDYHDTFKDEQEETAETNVPTTSSRAEQLSPVVVKIEKSKRKKYKDKNHYDNDKATKELHQHRDRYSDKSKTDRKKSDKSQNPIEKRHIIYSG